MNSFNENPTVLPSATRRNSMHLRVVPWDDHRLNQFEKTVKRLMDVSISAFAILFLSPLIIYTAIRTAFSGKGKILFLQERMGYREKPFKILKFRSMLPDAEKHGPQLSSTDDVRITKWGKVMRRRRLDELPQFWNVLKGDMSIVGPRPERKFYVNKITKTHPQYNRLLGVKPGITSLGMVKFGYAQNVEEMITRMKYDQEYISTVSIGLDIKIMASTVKIILLGKGK